MMPDNDADASRASFELLEQRLTASIAAVLRTGLALPQAATDHNIALRVRSTFETSCATAVSIVARERNATMSRQSLFPPEIWCTVWSNLSSKSLIAVSHVCRNWRRLATSTAHLWKNVEYAAPPAQSAARRPQMNFASRRLAIRDAEIPGPIRLLDVVLTRSAQHPLALDIRLDPTRASADELAVLLYHYRHRIAAMALSFVDMRAAAHLLSSFTALSSLHTLSLAPMPGNQRGASTTFFETLSTPVLTALHLDDVVAFRTAGPNSLPSLQSLRLACATTSQLAHVLMSCPFLLELDVTLVATATAWLPLNHIVDSGGAPVPPESLLERACRIVRVRVRNVNAHTEGVILALFAPSARQHLSLHYLDETVQDGFGVLGEALADGAGGSLALTCAPAAHTCAHMRVVARAPDGRERALLFPFDAAAHAFPRAWKFVPLAALVELALDQRMWTVARHGLGELPNLTTVTVHFCAHRVESVFGGVLGLSCTWPVVGTLRVVGQGQARVSVATVRKLIASLCLPELLPVLHFEGVVLLGSADDFASVAQSVVLKHDEFESSDERSVG